MVNIVHAEPIFKKDSTSKLIEIFISNSASTTGGGLTGLLFSTTGLSAYYYCSGTTATPITLATMTVGTWATGGFKEIDSTNMPGWYQFGIPNAALASGCGDDVNFHFKGVAINMVPLPFAISLVDNIESDTYTLANSTGVKISDGPGTGQINLTSGAIDTVTSVTNAVTVGSINTDVITNTSIATSAVDEITGGITSTLSAGSTSTSLISASFVGTGTNDYVGWIAVVNDGSAIVKSFNPTTDTVTLASSIGTVNTGDTVKLLPASLYEILYKARLIR